MILHTDWRYQSFKIRFQVLSSSPPSDYAADHSHRAFVPSQPKFSMLLDLLGILDVLRLMNLTDLTKG